jgi:hypothetical protein
MSQLAGKSSRWIAVWIKTFSQPKNQTFIDISGSPDAQPSSAYLWIFLAGFLFITSSGISYALSASQINLGIRALITLICAALLIGGALVLSFALSVAIKQWIAKLLGGTGTYPKLAYAFGAIYAPFALVSSVFVLLGALPSVGRGAGAMIGLFFLYAIFLQITAVKAINHFGWGAAAVSVLIPFAAVLLFCGFIVPIGIAAIEPVARSLFPQNMR